MARTASQQWMQYENRVPQLLLTVAVGISAAAGVEPRGTSGLGLLTVVVLVLNIALMATRLLPERMVSWLPFSVVAALAAAALVGLDTAGTSFLFAYFLAGQVGFTRRTGQAIGLAILTSVSCSAALIISNATGHSSVPWLFGALTGVAVFVGIANRNRESALRSARDTAVATAQAAQSEARAQAMAERARIARDVHDVLAHSLAGINLQLEVVDALLEAGDVEPARESARKAQKMVREGLAEVSRTVHAMRADALPLVETLTSLVDGAAPPGTRLEVVGSHRDVPTPKTTALARCAQESLTNARKYAPDAGVRVVLTFAAETTELDVTNGPSTRRSAGLADGSGLGLVGMRERVATVGGSVQTGPIVEGECAGGWRVHVVIPA